MRTSRSTLTQNGSTGCGPINLFKTYLYLIELCTKQKNILSNNYKFKLQHFEHIRPYTSLV